MSRYFAKTLASLEPYTPGEQLKIADIVKLQRQRKPVPARARRGGGGGGPCLGCGCTSDLTNGDLNAAIARHWGVRPETSSAATAATKTCCWRCGPFVMKIRRWPLPM